MSKRLVSDVIFKLRAVLSHLGAVANAPIVVADAKMTEEVIGQMQNFENSLVLEKVDVLTNEIRAQQELLVHMSTSIEELLHFFEETDHEVGLEKEEILGPITPDSDEKTRWN